MRSKVIISTLLFIFLSVGLCASEENQDNRAELNKELTLDFVRILSEVYKLRNLTGLNFESAHEQKEVVRLSRLIVHRWENESDHKRKRVYGRVNLVLSRLDEAADSMLNLIKRDDEEELAKFFVKTKKARNELYGIAVSIMKKDGLLFSEEGKSRIFEYTYKIFEEEIDEYRKNKSEGKKTNYPSEIWAALFMSGVITKISDIKQ